MSDFELRSGGKVYSGWTALNLTRSMEELAHSFSVSLTDLWNEDSEPVPIEAGDTCSISIDGEVLVSGYVDSNNESYDARTRRLGFAGRSSTGDLVDCAAIHKGGQWRNQGLQKIAEDICFPFELSVSANVDLGKTFRRFSIQEGETAFATIERAARMRGVLPMTGSDGNLVFDRVSTERISTAIERGVNVKSGSLKNDWQDIFSVYLLKTQAAGDDESFGSASSSIMRRAANADVVGRYRPSVIMAENEDSGKELQARADWERNVRAGRAKRLTYTVAGWKHADGVWSPNQRVRVIDPWLRIDDELIVASTTQSRDNSGSITSMDLTFPEAFDIQPLPQPKKKRTSLY